MGETPASYHMTFAGQMLRSRRVTAGYRSNQWIGDQSVVRCLPCDRTSQ
jgi:hypothetical protein